MTNSGEQEIFYQCPQGHGIRGSRENFGYEPSEERDADGRPMVESGLFCLGCQRVYGLSKLFEINS